MPNSSRRCILLALLGTVGAAASTARPPIGWSAPADYVEAAGGSGFPELRREYYLQGEDATRWTERVQIGVASASPADAAATPLQALEAARRAQCPKHFSSLPIPKQDPQQPLDAAVWFCPRDAQGRGRVGMHRIQQVAGHAYALQIEAEYAPYEPGTVPATEPQLERWTAFLASFSTCDTLTRSGCMPEPQLLMQAAEATPDAAEAVQVEAAERRGRSLYRQDQLAWVGSDFAVERGLIDPRKPKDGSIFVAVPGPGKTGRVYFLSGQRRVRIEALVEFDAEGRPSQVEPPRRVPADVLLRLKALRLAQRQEYQRCTERMNVAMLPAEDGEGWWVYLLGATTMPEIMWLGGHTRLRIDARARRVLDQQSSARSCLALDLNRFDTQAGSAGESTLVVTHLVSAVPWETHVLQSLTFERPMIVLTETAAWRVDGDRVTKLALD